MVLPLSPPPFYFLPPCKPSQTNQYQELNCTIPLITDPFFHLLEFYIHNDAPLSCRIPSRPPPHITSPSSAPPKQQEYVPLIFALAGTLQLSHLHISTHMNILLHSTPKHHLHHHDSGVIDCGAAYSTSPLSHLTGPRFVFLNCPFLHQLCRSSPRRTTRANLPNRGMTKKLVIGDPLPLSFSIRWFPSPSLPRENGKVEWAGMGGHFFTSTFVYCIVSAIVGGVASAVWVLAVVVPRRMRGRALGGATPLGYGVGGGGVGNGWGVGKRVD